MASSIADSFLFVMRIRWIIESILFFLSFCEIGEGHCTGNKNSNIASDIVTFISWCPEVPLGMFPPHSYLARSRVLCSLFLVCFDDRNVQILFESMVEGWRHKRTRRIADALRARKNGILHLPLLIILDRVIIIRTPALNRKAERRRTRRTPCRSRSSRHRRRGRGST